VGIDSMSLATSVLVEKKDRVAIVELNRPESLNALNTEALQLLACKLKELTIDDDVQIIILKGKGKAFSSGGDIKMMLSMNEEKDFFTIMDYINEIALTLYSMPKLTICAIQGAAAGLGLSLALASDFIVADHHAKIAMNFIGIGLIPDGGGHFFVERRLGEVKAKELIWEGKVMTAQEAFEKQLIDQIADGNLEEVVQNKIDAWLNSPIQAMIKSKKILAEINRPKLLKILELEKYGQLKMRQTKDHLEGIQAFVEKRKPKFKGM
jgi:2-(1,2-epoxy-1,2-dihydrophenyl)acetyl-CoA isomerase